MGGLPMPSVDEALLSEALVFSARECSIEAGGVHELAVPMSKVDGGFLVYEYAEASDEGVRFTVSTPGHSLLLDELQPRSSDQLHVAAGLSTLLILKWANTEAWLASVQLSYTVRVISMEAVRTRLDQRLLHAAEHGLGAAITECLAGGASLRAVDQSGHTPLLRAVLANQAEATSALLLAGAPVQDKDRHGNTPLHLGALVGAGAETIGALVAGGAPIDARNAEGATPLLLAAFRRGPAAADAGSTSDAAAALLAAGANVSAADSHGNTALHFSASQGQMELLKTLLAGGAPPSVRNARGETPMSLAAARGSDECVEMLLRATAGHTEPVAGGVPEQGGGATVPANPAAATEAERALSLAVAAPAAGAATSTGKRCRMILRLLSAPVLRAHAAAAALDGAPRALINHTLLLSCQEGLEVPALRLLDAGASLAAADRQGDGGAAGIKKAGAGGDVPGPLTLAAAAGHAALVSLLLRRDANAKSSGAPHIRPDDRRLAVDSAAARGHTAVVRSLLDESGADAATEWRALQVAAGAGRTGIVLALLLGEDGTISGDAVVRRDATALLHAAAAGGHTTLALALLRRGCQLSSAGDQGRNAARTALDHGFEQCAIAMLRAASDDDALRLLGALPGTGRPGA